MPCLLRLQSTESAEERLLPLRQQLHTRLCLPPDRPLLRVANALAFAPDQDTDAEGQATSSGRPGRLPDVHVGLPPSGVRGGTVHLTDGSYDYHHYMQVRISKPCNFWSRAVMKDLQQRSLLQRQLAADLLWCQAAAGFGMRLLLPC